MSLMYWVISLTATMRMACLLCLSARESARRDVLRPAVRRPPHSHYYGGRLQKRKSAGNPGRSNAAQLQRPGYMQGPISRACGRGAAATPLQYRTWESPPHMGLVRVFGWVRRARVLRAGG